MSRLPRFAGQAGSLLVIASIGGFVALIAHVAVLQAMIVAPDGLTLSLGNAASLIGMLLALTALGVVLEPTLRGLGSGLLLLAGIAALATGWPEASPGGVIISWQMEAHVLISLLAYGVLTVGAIVAVFALVQDRRLRAARLSPANRLFAPLETTERLLYGIAAAGFLTLLLAVFSGFLFVNNLFAQHLVHKTVLSLLALLLFGVLLAGRWLAGWRGRRAVYLYLWGFVVLGLAYFGSRFVLEQVLGRTWG
ncbi:MAG TPA: cytochrome c biogenesis protein CcsA [Woeseiaceae bacterium]|nr:cytochrome c biogenesis protein CcsA [Woeseiaceae bacterium]